MISQAGSGPAPQPSFRGDTLGGHAQGGLRAPRRGGLRERNVRPRGNSFASRQRCRAAAFVPRTEPRALAQMNKGARAGAKLRAKLRRTNPGRRSRTSGAKPREASGNTIGPRSARSTRHVRSAARSAVAAPHPRARRGPTGAAGRSCAKLERTSPGSRSRTFGAKPREASENTTGRAATTSTRHIRSPARSARAAPHPGLPKDAGAKPHRASESKPERGRIKHVL